MESKAYLRRGKVGMPKAVTVRLQNDVITIANKEATILTAPITSLSDVGQSMGLIAFKVNGEYYALDFIKIWQKLFGLGGLLFAGKGRAAAKNLRQMLEAKGIVVKNQLM